MSVPDTRLSPRPRRLLLVVNDAAFFLSHRLPVALAARAAGYDVHVATAPSIAVPTITAHGLTHHEVPLSRSGVDVGGELHTIVGVWRLFRRLQPDIVHCVTIKPVLYGGLVARVTGVPAMVGAVSGLGFVFVTHGAWASIRRAIVRLLYRLALGHHNMVLVFQNPDDRRQLSERVGLPLTRSVLIRGSGVDVAAYPSQPRDDGATPVVVMASRLLSDKGVREYVAAARLIRAAGLPAIFRLAGDIDVNPASISAAELAQWRAEGVVEVLGFRQDVADLFATCDIVVLPSYREGLPKVLLEAAAAGRVVVTTDVPGCRDAIVPDVTGLLVPARDASALADAIMTLIRDPSRRRRMGAAGRALAEREFTIESVIAAHLQVYRDVDAAA
jgi:glycosyltransferase involved in cell wall biosynthesis